MDGMAGRGSGGYSLHGAIARWSAWLRARRVQAGKQRRPICGDVRTLLPHKEGTDAICLPVAQQVDIYYGALDTVGIAPGLPADFARTFEMRAAAAVYAAPATAVADLPVRTYGEVTVRLTDPNTTVRNAGGFASKFVDNLGCVRVKPSGLYGPGASYALEDQADTASFSYAFVRGYIHSVTTPVCGEARVFELLSRN